MVWCHTVVCAVIPGVRVGHHSTLARPCKFGPPLKGRQGSRVLQVWAWRVGWCLGRCLCLLAELSGVAAPPQAGKLVMPSSRPHP